jgi:hypothetical protein
MKMMWTYIVRIWDEDRLALHRTLTARQGLVQLG